MSVKSLEWKSITYKVQRKNTNLLSFKQKTLNHTVLNNVSGFVVAGSCTAVIGPSGAGKTTLLAAISLRIKETFSGSVLLNGKEIQSNELKLCSAYIPQQEVFQTNLTLKEHLIFIAHLKIRKNIQQVNTKIQEILTLLGLQSCIDTPIYCLSGGQKRKVMLAGELLTDVKIFFCDEPTTGLDSFSAYSVVETLRDLAGLDNTEAKRIVLCSIHQPNSQLFHRFSHIILMHECEILFHGSLQEAEIAFSKVGLLCPQLYNPCEFYIKMVSTPSCYNKIKRLQNQESHDAKRKTYLDEYEGIDSHVMYKTTMIEKIPFWFFQMYLLLLRNARVTYRNIKVHMVQSLIYLSTAVIIGLLYGGVKPNEQASIQDISGAFFTVVTEIIFTNIYFVVYLVPNELSLLRREVGENLYSVSSFYVAQVLLMVPKVLVETLLFISILLGFTYYSFQWTFFVFFQIFLSLSVGAFASMSYGFLLSGIFESIKMTLELAPPMDLILLMLSGIYINLRSFPYGKYISFFYYTNEAIVVSYWSSVKEMNCSSNSSLPCYRNGTEVLDSLGFNTDPTIIYNDYFGLFCLSLFCHIFGYLGVKRLINKQSFY